MDHRTPLKLHTVLAFEGMPCHIADVIGQGSNAIVYKGWYQDRLNPELSHHVLVKELFPFHPQQKIRRDPAGSIIVEPEAKALWETHRESFEIGNRVHLRLLADHPDLMVMGANLNSFQLNGTLYSVLGYTGGRSLQAELGKGAVKLRRAAQWMIGLLDALEAFHKSGYLHLDISPDNIMLVGQESQERMFLIDYNSARELGSRSSSYLSCKAGYSPPELTTGNVNAFSFSSDLYSVAAVFYRCVMGRKLDLAETLRSKAPNVQESPLLKDSPQTVVKMVEAILKKGLHTLHPRRYQSIGQMRQAFGELLDRIDCVGVTHWSLWENGKRSVEEMIRINPSLRYLTDDSRLYPIRLEQNTLSEYLEQVLSPEGASGLILAQGGMGKTTLLLHTAMLQGKRYSPTAPAVFYVSLNGWTNANDHYIRSQILLRMRFKKEENTFDSAMHALHKLLEQPIHTKSGDSPSVLLLLDGLNETRGDTTALVQEISLLNSMPGVRILAASRSEVPEIHLNTAQLMPLNEEDIQDALSQNGLLIPQNREILQLLRTPLILSVYIQANEGTKQQEIRSEAELMQSYLAALLEKEIRHLPEDSPRKWQTDVALNYVLPAIARETKRLGTGLTQEQLMRLMGSCWNTLNSRAFRKAFPQWIGHSADIRGDAKTAEEWFGLVIHSLLWQQLGMLVRDDHSGGYRVFHQVVAEHLADREIPIVSSKKRLVILAAFLLCVLVLLGYTQYQAKQAQLAAEAEIKTALELGAGSYTEYGNLYRQLSSLVDYAAAGDIRQFDLYYDRVLADFREELEETASERAEKRKAERSSVHDQLAVTWGTRKTTYEYTILSELLQYPEERAKLYTDCIPLLKIWMESDAVRQKTPNFAECFAGLLEADANLAAEMYHRAVGVHLSGSDTAWLENMNELVAMVKELDAHRDTSIRDDRGQLLSSLQSAYLKASGEFETACSKLNAYARSLS